MGNRRAERRTRAGLGYVLAVALAVTAGGSPARADLTLFDIFKNAGYTQTGTVQPTTPVSLFFASRGFENNTGDFAQMTLAYPGPGSPAALGVVSPTVFSTSFPSVATKSALDAAFPFGTYTLTASGGSAGTVMASISYTQDAYPSAVPYLTGTTFTGLQGLDPSKPFNVTFNGFASQVSPANESDVFFAITQTSTNQSVYSQNFLPATTTSLTLPANTLLPNTQYSLFLDYSNRINGFSGTFLTQGFDYGTTAQFTTGAVVPEPSSFALSLCGGLIGLGALWRRNRRASAETIG